MNLKSLKYFRREYLEEIFEIFGVNRGTCTNDVTDQLRTLTKTYLFDRVFDYLCFYFGTELTESMIKYAHWNILSERIQISDLDIKTSEFTVLIDYEFEPAYFDKMMEEICNGDMFDIFYDRRMKCGFFSIKICLIHKTKKHILHS